MSSVQPQVPIVQRQGHPPIVASQPSKYSMSQKVAGAFAILGAIFAFLSPALGVVTILGSLLIFSFSSCCSGNANQNSNVPAATVRTANRVILGQRPAPVVIHEQKASQPGPVVHVVNPTRRARTEGKASQPTLTATLSRPCAGMTGPMPHGHPPVSSSNVSTVVSPSLSGQPAITKTVTTAPTARRKRPRSSEAKGQQAVLDAPTIRVTRTIERQPGNEGKRQGSN